MDVGALFVNLIAAINVTTVLVTLLLGLLLWAYKWANTPVNRIKRLGDIGYNFPQNATGKQKAELVRRAQKLRQVNNAFESVA